MGAKLDLLPSHLCFCFRLGSINLQNIQKIETEVNSRARSFLEISSESLLMFEITFGSSNIKAIIKSG